MAPSCEGAHPRAVYASGLRSVSELDRMNPPFAAVLIQPNQLFRFRMLDLVLELELLLLAGL